MSDWADHDEQATGPALEQVDQAPAQDRREPGRAFGLDLRELATELVETAFQNAVRKQLATATGEQVGAAFASVLDDDLLGDLRARASTAVADAVTDQLGRANADRVPDDTAPPLYYGSVDEFVREYLIHADRRRIDGHHRVWAATWWEYDEAVIRLEALWRSWEALRLDPATGMSVWWRDHADHHMSVLLSPDGPFAGVPESDQNRNKKGEPLPYTPPPPGLFPDVRYQTHLHADVRSLPGG